MKNLISALIKFQKDVPVIPKNKLNPHYKSYYAELSTVIDVCLPVLNKHGLLVTQVFKADNQNVLVTMLCHDSGETLESHIFLPEIVDPQKLTGAITYLRRTSYLSILGLCADDDMDGNETITEKAAPKVNKAPSEAQLKAIWAISKKLQIEPIKPVSFEEASAWINKHGSRQ